LEKYSTDKVPMKEKRKFERFDLHIETMLNIRDEAERERLPMLLSRDRLPVLLSRDISCAGVFLLTERPLPIGTPLHLNLLLSQHELGSKSKDERINISTSGKVVRTDDQGMAIAFDKLYKISPVKLQPEFLKD
jgi:hypothetical protein